MQPQAETGTNNGGRGKGFFRSLFDLSFRHFVTGRVVSFLYVISLILATLNALFSAGYASVLLGTFFTAVAGSSALGWVGGIILFLVVAPLFLLVSIVYVRVILEIVVVLFRIADNTAETALRLGVLDPGSLHETTVGATNRPVGES
jgi:hypothetical protein